MADRTIQVIVKAETQDLLTIDEAKMLLGMPTADTSQDEHLAMLITIFSTTVAELCNRTFGRETVVETWRDTYNGRLFLSHWPVAEADVESVLAACVPLDPSQYELEEDSGKLSFIANPCGATSSKWPAPATVTYTGGYLLPDDAPPPLKKATALLIQDDQIRSRQAQTAGIRQVAHKEARVTFFDPNAVLIKAVGVKTQGMQAAETILRPYIRIEV